MELLIISGYVAVCIAVFSVLRIPLNRWTVPTASIGGVVMIFALVQVLNYYHPYSGTSRQYSAAVPGAAAATVGTTTGEGPNLVAWFHQNSLLRLGNGNAAEVTFDSIPGKVFTGEVQMVLPTLGDEAAQSGGSVFEQTVAASQTQIPVVINITDPRYANYVSQLPGGSHARAAVYGEEHRELALVRKTLLRMSAWMNYLTLFS